MGTQCTQISLFSLLEILLDEVSCAKLCPGWEIARIALDDFFQQTDCLTVIFLLALLSSLAKERFVFHRSTIAVLGGNHSGAPTLRNVAPPKFDVLAKI